MSRVKARNKPMLVGVHRQGTVKAQAIRPVPEGGERCPVCGHGVRLRADGSRFAHSSSPGVACPGGPPKAGTSADPRLCEHGSDFHERGVRCACPKHLRRRTA